MITKQVILGILESKAEYKCEGKLGNLSDMEFEEVAERIANLCNLPDVVQQRELLISYTKWLRQRSLYEGNFTEQQLADAYNKEINCG